MDYNKITHKINKYESSYSKTTWTTIEDRIKKDNRRNFIVILAIALVLSVMLVYGLKQQKEDNKLPTRQTEATYSIS